MEQLTIPLQIKPELNIFKEENDYKFFKFNWEPFQQ